MRPLLYHTYVYLVTLPDRLYPFATEIRGKRIRGLRSYEKAVARALRTYGAGRLGYKLTLYREAFHFLGSILFIVAAAFFSKEFFGSDAALYVLLYVAIAALTFQEFYVHPRQYKQHLRKGIVDWSVWVLPMLLYIFH